MSRQIISTPDAPAAIGTYSQAVKCGNTVHLSGQIALDPATKAMVNATVEEEIHRVFQNLAAVAKASGGSLADIAKLNIFCGGKQVQQAPLFAEEAIEQGDLFRRSADAAKQLLLGWLP